MHRRRLPRARPAHIAVRRLALEELRDLARGLHPSVLVDYGLRAAIEAGDRAPFRVSIDVDDVDGVPPSHRVAAYYVVSEALASAAPSTRFPFGVAGFTLVTAGLYPLALTLAPPRRSRSRPSASSRSCT